MMSDHKPLEAIMKKPLSSAPPRLQRMLLRLQKYNIVLSYKAGKEMILADTLSRAHIEETDSEIPEDELVAQVHMIYNSCAATDDKLQEIKQLTSQDPVLSEIANFVIQGWPSTRQNISEQMKPYWSYKEDLSLINGILFKDQRIVIPKIMRQEILKKLHQAHMGIEKTKLRARETVFWPGINRQIEDMVKSCETCLENQKKQAKETMIGSEIPKYPFQVVGTDLFYWNGQDFLLIVDYYSRYWEIEKLTNIRSKTVIQKLKKIFARLGIPEQLRSDNGTQYTSSDFKKFRKEWEFQHKTSSPHYHQSNGMAERHVQIAKKLLTKAKHSKQDPYLAILEALNTPVDGFASPAQLISGRRYRSILPINPQLLKVEPISKDAYVERRQHIQENQVKYYNQHTKPLKVLHGGEKIRMLNEKKWKPATVVQHSNEPRSYIVKNEDGDIYRRNRQYLLKTDDIVEISDDDTEQEEEKPTQIQSGTIRDAKPKEENKTCVNQEIEEGNDVRSTEEELNRGIRTRSGRLSKKPMRYGDYAT